MPPTCRRESGEGCVLVSEESGKLSTTGGKLSSHVGSGLEMPCAMDLAFHKGEEGLRESQECGSTVTGLAFALPIGRTRASPVSVLRHLWDFLRPSYSGVCCNNTRRGSFGHWSWYTSPYTASTFANPVLHGSPFPRAAGISAVYCVEDCHLSDVASSLLLQLLPLECKVQQWVKSTEFDDLEPSIMWSSPIVKSIVHRVNGFSHTGYHLSCRVLLARKSSFYHGECFLRVESSRPIQYLLSCR